MNTLVNKQKFKKAFRPTNPLAKDVKFAEDMMQVHLTDGRIISVPVIWFPLLHEATSEQRQKYEIGAGGASLHWEDNEVKMNLTKGQFIDLLQRLADGWNMGNARQAVDCFTVDALYTEPPDKQVYSGREALYKFFGGENGRAGDMNMVWHHIVFDEETQIGTGEFTFTYGEPVHGVTMIKVKDGLISNWREYWYASALSWEEFTSKNSF